MKVILISCASAGTGLATYSYNYYNAFKKLGVEVELVRAHRRSEKLNGIRFVVSYTSSIPSFLAKLRSKEGDIYHADYVDSCLAALLLGKKPVLLTQHDDIPYIYPEERGILWSKVYRAIFEIEKARVFVVTISKTMREKLIRERNFPPAKVFSVYNGVDLEKFYPKKKRKGGKVRIGFLGELVWRKRVDRLIDAFSILSKKHRNIELHIGGRGRMLKFLQLRAKKLELKNVFFYGFIREGKLNDFYNSLDIFVYPGDYEGFCLPVLEAMAAGTPVVATKVAAIPEIVGNAGILSEPDVESLARNIEKLIVDESLRERLREMGLRRAKKFTWENSAKEMSKVYEEILETCS